MLMEPKQAPRDPKWTPSKNTNFCLHYKLVQHYAPEESTAVPSINSHPSCSEPALNTSLLQSHRSADFLSSLSRNSFCQLYSMHFSGQVTVHYPQCRKGTHQGAISTTVGLGQNRQKSPDFATITTFQPQLELNNLVCCDCRLEACKKNLLIKFPK
jgi:hypothetical protein